MVEKIGVRLVSNIAVRDRPYHIWDSELKGFLLRVQPTGVVTYSYQYRTPTGRKHRIKIARVGSITPAQARDRALELSADVIKGNDPSAAKKANQVPTMAQFLDERYEPWITSSRKSGADTVTMLRSRFSFLVNRQLSAITAWDIEKWRSERVKSGITKQTTNRGFVSIKAMLNKAVEWDVIPENPLRKLKAYRVDTNPRTRFLSDDEEARLRKALIDREVEIRAGRDRGNSWRTERSYELYSFLHGKTFADHLRPMVLVSLNTGMRKGSLCNLRKEDLDLARRKITVPAAYSKAGRTYFLPMNQACYEVLSTWMQENADTSSPLVFPARDGKPIRELKTAWNKVLEKAKIEGFRWHDLRHTFASKLANTNQVGLQTIQKLLDHSSPFMTLRYAHLNETIMADAVAKLCEPKPEVVVKLHESAKISENQRG